MSLTRSHPVRLSLLFCALLAAVLSMFPGVVTARAATAPAADRSPDITLEVQPDGVVSTATVALTDTSGVAARSSNTGTVSRRMSTDPFSQVGLTWRGTDPQAQVRVRRHGTWSRWMDLEQLGDGPGKGSAEGRAAVAQRASDLVWVGTADGVQVRSSGARTRDLDLVLIDPGTTPSDHARTTTATGPNPAEKKAAARVAAADGQAAKRTAARTKGYQAPMPNMNARKKWKPDPRKLNGKPVHMKGLKQVHIHHTASTNNYTRADVPRMIRGMYNYHTDTLGWFDIGYNFLVDRFARIWVGRSGGPRRLVRGAHTLGFNHKSVGIAMIGNFVSTMPPRKARTAIVKLAAWKFTSNNRTRATGKVKIKSQGSDRFKKGRVVRLPRIDGHRDTNQTACPGQLLYNKLPTLRKRTQQRIDRFTVPD